MKFSPANHHDRECLLAITGRVPLELAHAAALADQARHAALDDASDWALNRWREEASRMGAELQAQMDSDNRRTLMESVQHMLAGDVPRCQGTSCRQGRAECKEGCHPLSEMACTAGYEDEEVSPLVGLVWAGAAVCVVALGVWLY